MQSNNDTYLDGIQQRDESALKQAFVTNFSQLHGYASLMLNDADTSTGIVQDVFYDLWTSSPPIVTSSLTAHLYSAVHGKCIAYLKQQGSSSAGPEGQLHDQIVKAMSELPEQTRIVYQLSRYHDLRYNEIATEMQMPANTVAAHMGKALKTMRLKLSGVLALLVFILLNV